MVELHRQLLVGVLVVSLLAVPVAATGETAVFLTTDVKTPEDSIAVGENITVAVVVDNASEGVGSYDLTVTVDDPDIARVVDVNLQGAPGENITSRTDSEVTVSAIEADTRDGRAVRVVEVILSVESQGTLDVSLTVDRLGDEQGDAYTVTDTEGLSLTIGGIVAQFDTNGEPGIQPAEAQQAIVALNRGNITPQDAQRVIAALNQG